MAGEDEIYVDHTVTDGVRDEFTTLGQELIDLTEPIHTQSGRVDQGAGEFADELRSGLSTFELSWEAAFETSGRSSGNIAANVGRLTLDLQAVDLELTVPTTGNGPR